MDKQNCWQFRNCGREPGGAKSLVDGPCPASTCEELGGTHQGHMAGRACWVVAGTYCGGNIQGEYAQKLDNCNTCDFYKKVKSEEGVDFVLAATLLAKRKGS